VTPATTVWLEGRIFTEKLVAVNDAVVEMVWFVLLLLVAVTVTEPLPEVVGVTAKATVAMEPDCRTGIRQTAVLPVGRLQMLPDPAEALVKVADILVESWPPTVMFVAKSGPWLMMVKVIVIGLPAPTTFEAGEYTGATQVIHKLFAGRSITANASMVVP
jgi:hypothetical protein